eukprot:6950770-Alexandrium_andersonii.AAC.1
MSASLVGSEMCIRDSCRTGPPTSPGTPGQRGSPCRLVHPAGAAWRCRAVSYTHLTLPTICSV